MTTSDTTILAIDQGTTNTKVILINAAGEITAQASRPVSIHFPQPAWVEQDPMQIWKSVRDAIDDCLHAAGQPALAAVAISNQRESAVAWERRTGQPVGPLISWQCRRTAPFCASLREQNYGDALLARTGLIIDPLFTGSKIRWLLEHTPDGRQRAAQGEICVGTVDSWLLWNLTGGTAHRTDVSNASRTQLFNLGERIWDRFLLESVFDIPAACLPEVLYSSALFGESAQIGALPAGIPIASLIGDSHAALFGHAGFQPGVVKATYGTGSSLMTPTARIKASNNGLASTIAWGYTDVVYALEGNISVTGAAVDWLGSFLGIGTPAQVADRAAQVDSTEGIYVVPALVGLGAPHWDDRARGLITGLTRGSTVEQVARAVIESIAYQIRDVFDVMQSETDDNLSVLLVDGGGTRNAQLMQFQADILGVTVQRNNTPELSAMGAAYLAGLGVGIWSSTEEVAYLHRSIDRFEPRLPAARRDQLYAGWQEAVARTKLHVS